MQPSQSNPAKAQLCSPDYDGTAASSSLAISSPTSSPASKSLAKIWERLSGSNGSTNSGTSSSITALEQASLHQNVDLNDPIGLPAHLIRSAGTVNRADEVRTSIFEVDQDPVLRRVDSTGKRIQGKPLLRHSTGSVSRINSSPGRAGDLIPSNSEPSSSSSTLNGLASSWGRIRNLQLWETSPGAGGRHENNVEQNAGFTRSKTVRSTSKGKEKASITTVDNEHALVANGKDHEDYNFPLDGEEGIVVDDEACFVDGWEGKVDYLSSLPHEVSLYILLHLDFRELLTCSTVSRQWRALSEDNLLWRDLFHREKTWRVRDDLIETADSFGVGSSPVLGASGDKMKMHSKSTPTKALRRGYSGMNGTSPNGRRTRPEFSAANGESPVASAAAGRFGRRWTDMMMDLSTLGLTGTARNPVSTTTSSSDQGRVNGDNGHTPTPPMAEWDFSPQGSQATATPRRPASGITSTTSTSTVLSRAHSSAALNLSAPSLGESSTNSPSHVDGFSAQTSSSSSRRVSSSTLPPLGPVPSPSLSYTPQAPLFLDWPRLYSNRHVLEQRWDKGQPKSTWLKGHTDSVYCVQFDEKKVISGGRDQLIRVWDIKTGTCVKTLSEHSGSVLCLQYDDKVLISGSSDCRLLIWDLVGDEKGQGRWSVKKELVGHNMGILDLCFDDDWIVSSSKDTTIRVWKRSTGELYRTLSGHRGPVNAVQILHHHVLSASGDALMKLWDVQTGEVIRVFSGHERGLACAQLSPSGKLIASGSNDKLIKLWDAETGECLRTIEGHTDLVRTLAFDEHRRRIVSGSYDRTIRVWDMDTGESLLRFKAHSSLVFDVSFSASRILSTSHDQRILILDFGDGLDVSKFI